MFGISLLACMKMAFCLVGQGAQVTKTPWAPAKTLAGVLLSFSNLTYPSSHSFPSQSGQDRRKFSLELRSQLLLLTSGSQPCGFCDSARGWAWVRPHHVCVCAVCQALHLWTASFPATFPTPFSHILVISLDLGFLQSRVPILLFLSHFCFFGGPDCTEYGILVLRLEMEAVHPAVESRVLTTGPPGKSLNPSFHLSLPTEHIGGIDEIRSHPFCVYTGGCHCLVTQSHPTLRDPMDCSSPGFLCPSPSPRAYSNSYPLSWWCHPTISSSISPFSCLQYFSASWYFPVSQLFTSGGQSIGASTSAAVLTMNIQRWFPFKIDWFDLLAIQGTLQSSPTLQFESINSLVLSLLYGPALTSIHDYWKNYRFD